MKLIPFAVFAACAFSSGCKSTQADESSPIEPLQRWAEQQEPTLYARDGSVVQGPKARSDSKSATESAADAHHDPVHDIGARDGSRMYLLELYQKSVEERESLTREVKSLQAALTKVGDAQAAVEKERDGARVQIEKLQGELDKARADNQELAGRLLTAQIRRLEAEKMLLETRIASLQHDPNDADTKSDAVEAGGEAPAPAKPVSKPTPPPHGSRR